ncbi:ABC transporter ATP-binding protein, partial [Paenibacillus sp. P22]|uniref:ABC transporter ATP-binding protein n=2 Tax=Paenibacillus TaxID=44249 RepID=UPI0006613E2D
MGSITFNHVFKRYKGEARPAVDDFHLSIEEGEFLVLVGPSGCGKSTTLRMLAGLEEISSGELYMDGKFINYVSPKDRDIAMVFQNYALYPNLSVFENIALGLKLRKTAKHEIGLRVNRVAKILEISHLLERKPSQLSGGQKQRVALGRAIAREPQVFLMDEPLSNLDAKLRAQTRAELIKLQSDLKRTTVYVTHDQVEAMTMGTRIVVMKDGVIQQVAPPRKLYDEPANLFVAGFIGSPQMNFIPGRIQREDGTLYFANRRMKLPLPVEMERRLGGTDRSLRSVVLGVRPEHVRLSAALPEGEDSG